MKKIIVFNDFSRFGGSKLASFSYVFRVPVSRSFFDRLRVGFGVDFGAAWAPKWGHVGLKIEEDWSQKKTWKREVKKRG